jgi:hypothetical protein
MRLEYVYAAGMCGRRCEALKSLFTPAAKAYIDVGAAHNPRSWHEDVWCLPRRKTLGSNQKIDNGGHKMITRTLSVSRSFRFVFLMLCLVIAAPVIAQAPRTIEAFRAQYDIMMANYEQLYAAEGNIEGQMRARQGRVAMQAVTNEQLARVFAKSRIPDFSVVASASKYLVERQASAGAAIQKSLPFPGEPPIVSGCNGVDYTSATRYAELIANEVAQSILAAAAWVCNEDILGENGSLACVPLAIAADITQGLFDTAQFCAGEVTANQVEANFDRLGHIHDDLSAGIASIITNDNANTTTIVNNDNANTTTIVNNDNKNTASIITNSNANKDAIVSELRALGCEIVRLLNTPEGRRASSILACNAQPGFPYSWNKR